MTVVAAAVLQCKAGPYSECSGLQDAVLGALQAAAFGAHVGHISIPSAVMQNQAVEKELLKYFLWVKNICCSVNFRAVCVNPTFLHSWWLGGGCYRHDLAWAMDACPLRIYNGNRPLF